MRQRELVTECAWYLAGTKRMVETSLHFSVKCGQNQAEQQGS